ncbi:thrombospondin type 3 repeat-containing protein, partial [Nanoarchaeota archaeon]
MLSWEVNIMRLSFVVTFLAFALMVLLTTIVLAADAKAQPYYGPMETCAISTGSGLLQDFDCDKIPDYIDNCPDIPNPQQKDSNNDNIGDECAALYGIQPATATGTSLAEKAAIKTTVTATSDTDADVKVIEIQDVHVGSAGAVYPIKLTNKGKTAKRFIIEINGIDFGTFRVDPSAVLI